MKVVRYKGSTFAGLKRYKYSLCFCLGFGMLCCCHVWCLCVSSVLPVLLWTTWSSIKLSSKCMAWLLYYTMLCLYNLIDCCWGDCKNTAVWYKLQAFSAALPIFLKCRMCPSIYFGNNKAFFPYYAMPRESEWLSLGETAKTLPCSINTKFFSAALPIILNCRMCPIYFGKKKLFWKPTVSLHIKQSTVLTCICWHR